MVKWEENSIVFRALQNFRNASLKIKAESSLASLVPESIPDSLPPTSRIR